MYELKRVCHLRMGDYELHRFSRLNATGAKNVYTGGLFVWEPRLTRLDRS